MWQGDIYLVIPEGKFLESYTLEADPKLIAEDWAKVNPPPPPLPPISWLGQGEVTCTLPMHVLFLDQT